MNSECFDKERKKLAQFASSTPSNKQLVKALSHNRKSVLDLVNDSALSSATSSESETDNTVRKRLKFTQSIAKSTDSTQSNNGNKSDENSNTTGYLFLLRQAIKLRI